MMFSWFSCTQQQRPTQAIYFDAFVERSILKEGEEGVLHILVDHKEGYTHQVEPPQSKTMDFLLLSRTQSQLGSLSRTHYQFRFTPSKGSHIIEPIVGFFVKNEEETKKIVGEIFVDVGLEDTKDSLHDVMERPIASPYLPVWLVGGACAFFMWYQHRKSKVAAVERTLEEEFRSTWADIKIHEKDPEKIVLMLSRLLRRYLGIRFGVELQSLGPLEFRKWVEAAPLRLAAKEAALRISQQIEELGFAGKKAGEEVLLSLGGDLEVIFVRGEEE